MEKEKEIEKLTKDEIISYKVTPEACLEEVNGSGGIFFYLTFSCNFTKSYHLVKSTKDLFFNDIHFVKTRPFHRKDHVNANVILLEFLKSF